jgi:SAM-dependent methyltransferase
VPERRVPSLTARRLEGDRLAYYWRTRTPRSWGEHWEENFTPEIYAGAERGKLGPFLDRPISCWLRGEGRILEAGCGLGQIVLALRRRGYEAEGVESARHTVEMVNRYRPDLPVRFGDVTCLDVPDGSYSAYISLGVMEHHREGPDPFLREANRVLASDGLAFISVPFFHLLRRWKAKLGAYRECVDGLPFYQYAFRKPDFRECLERGGFQLLQWAPYDSHKGLKDELPPLRWLLRKRLWGRVLARRLEKSSLLASPFGHMLLGVCRKFGNPG